MTGRTGMRWAAAAACAVGLALGAAAAAAQEFPSKPLRMLQGFPAGGTADVVSRVIGEEMAKSLGQPLIAEARPGAGGNLATEQVIKAAPDGHTMVLLTTAHVISPALMKAAPFDPVNDLEFVSKVADYPFFIAVHADSPFKTIKELIDAAKAKPGSINWGSAGVGSGQHMCGELLALSTGIKIVHVPFRGDAGSVTALLSKSIDFIIAPSTVLIGNIEGGNFRALAISSARRADSLKDVPTVAETVAPGFDMQAMAGIATTKGTPKPIVERLTTEVHRALAQPAVDKRLRELGGIPAPSTGPEMTRYVESQIKRWRDVAERAGIQRQ